jgi:hypothetical protein
LLSTAFINLFKFRERAEIAEQEGYKLKGILSHMEHVVQNLQGQGFYLINY